MPNQSEGMILISRLRMLELRSVEGFAVNDNLILANAEDVRVVECSIVVSQHPIDC